MLKRIKLLFLCLILCVSCLCGCEEADPSSARLRENTDNSTKAASEVIENQPAPTDLNYSLERYNLIKRAYWVNGQREKANTLPCAVDKPLGYIVLFSENGSVVGKFVVDGKVSSLGSYLFPAQQDVTSDGKKASLIYHITWRRTNASVFSVEVPGIDGAYGSNVSGIFFFTTDGKYIEWTGDFLYSDIPFEVDEPILKVGGNE